MVITALLITAQLTMMECSGPPVLRARIADRLAFCCGEAKQAISFTNAQLIYELWGNFQTGTWTVLRTSPAGLSCVVAVGEGLHSKPGKKV